MDKNDNGSISQHELFLGLQRYLGSDVKESEMKNIFDNLDMDRSGSIGYEEFTRGACDKRTFLDEKVLKFAFNFFDKDNSDIISSYEVEEVLRGNGENIKQEEVMNLIREVDRNSDGKINFNEFKLCMQKLIES